MAEETELERADDGMPTGEALNRAREELEDIEPGPTDALNFTHDGVTTQTDEEPIHDFLGRSDGA